MARQGRSQEVGFGIFKDHETDWVFHRTLAFVGEKAAEIGECLYTAQRIDEKDGESWIQAWAEVAALVEAQAEIALRRQHIVSAREAFWRASNYYRTAEYGAVPTHPQFHTLWQKSVDCFQKSCHLFDPPIQVVHVDFEGKQLPGYFWQPNNTAIARPTLIAAGGNDSSLEEVVFWVGAAAVRRGYNFFTFEHPGHRGAVHRYPGCVKRPDYETPYAAALDYLESLPGTDERFAMTGYSFGGYVTCRVAVHEPRLHAIIPNPPIIDFARLVGADSQGSLFLKLPPTILDWLAERGLRRSPLRYSLAKYTMWAFGTPHMRWSDFANFETQRPFVIRDDLHTIQAPTLIMIGAGEGAEMLRQGHVFYDSIGSQIKHTHIFTIADDRANDHCQLDNRAHANQVMFDWLDELFADD